MTSTERAAGILATAVLVSFGSLPERASGQDGIVVPDLPVHELTLDNGLRLIILPKPSAPTVAFVVEYAVGGVN
ncbi:MAG: hypothetical protein OXN92_05530, partial [Gammaproteobacteria bacterium]|nr:hypothetical protein [Gammaproteobacteria bacterium]